MAKKKNSEDQLALDISGYLCRRYPNVLFRFDYGAGIKLTIGQAAKQKRLQKVKSWPDLTIFEPRHGYHGLVIELKQEDVRVYKKNGQIAKNEHIQSQANVLSKLNSKGYLAVFGIGLQECIKVIDDYLQVGSNDDLIF